MALKAPSLRLGILNNVGRIENSFHAISRSDAKRRRKAPFSGRTADDGDRDLGLFFCCCHSECSMISNFASCYIFQSVGNV